MSFFKEVKLTEKQTAAWQFDNHLILYAKRMQIKNRLQQ
jgi:hypothetical protein